MARVGVGHRRAGFRSPRESDFRGGHLSTARSRRAERRCFRGGGKRRRQGAFTPAGRARAAGLGRTRRERRTARKTRFVTPPRIAGAGIHSALYNAAEPAVPGESIMHARHAPRYLACIATATFAVVTAAHAGEIRVACYSDGNECEVTQDLAKRFESQNADVKVVVDKVPYKAILEQLPVQLAAGEGPDIA